ncbi:hypothetical protein [Polaribacter sp. R77954]|uniref:hypothetical protein n=1 Tax=Polaribacter sp. R77954 TaxID=3093870 RepID=UPI0037C674C9
MKIRNSILFGISILFLSSCVVKSLNPFYTKKTISYDNRFIGKWTDSKKGVWTVVRFRDEITKNNPVEKMKKDDLQLYKEYKNSYYIQREFKGEEALFLATPFKINNQTFLDFYPLEYQDDINNLLESHLIYTHSLVKYVVQKNGKIDVRWLDEDKIETLFKEKKIKIKHKKIGTLKNKYLLTATSKDLEKFIEKYMNSKDEDKWDTSTKFTLSKTSETE